MSTETDRKAQDLYPFDGSDPDTILALRSAFRAGAEFAAEHDTSSVVPEAHAIKLEPFEVDLEVLTAYFEGVSDEMVLRVRRNPNPKEDRCALAL